MIRRFGPIAVRSALVTCLSLASLAVVAARIDVVNPNETEAYWSHIRVMIEGPIVKGDASKVLHLLPGASLRALSRRYDPNDFHDPIVGISSPGGDVEEAMKLGRGLRERSATLLVKPNGRCESACVLVLVGAATKVPLALPPYGETALGVHRIRPAGTRVLDQSPAQATREYNIMRMKVERYLKEMGASPALADIMFRTGSETMKYLTHLEATQLGLVGMDPGLAEYVRARKVDRYGDRCVAKEDSYLACLNGGSDDQTCRHRTGFAGFPCR